MNMLLVYETGIEHKLAKWHKTLSYTPANFSTQHMPISDFTKHFVKGLSKEANDAARLALMNNDPGFDLESARTSIVNEEIGM